jgi:hypothetical protein
MNNTELERYFLDCISLIKDAAFQAKEQTKSNPSDYEMGRLMAYCEVVSLLQLEAKAFEISLKDIGLDGFEAEKDLLF